MGMGEISLEALSALSSVALTAMSTIVAGVALLVSYRQNVGWKPVVLVTGTALGGSASERRYTMTLQLEFWNRRKYPLALRFLSARIDGVELADSSATSELGPDIRRNRLRQQLTDLVAPHAHSRMPVAVTFEKQSLDAMKPLFQFEIGYFDPRLNRLEKMRVEHRFFYPELGWKADGNPARKIGNPFSSAEAVVGKNEAARTVRRQGNGDAEA